MKLLFVCLGNICRSPSAENIMRHLVNEAGLGDQITCDSAGTSSYHIGSAPERR
ncbi:MAG: low molecular weight phosphotyrosine protein phosphatase, partial [Prochlorothrix sp.]